MLPSAKKPYIAYFLLVLASLTAYGWTLKYSFIGDDFLLLEDAHYTWSRANFFTFIQHPFITFGNGFWRPFFNLWKNILYFFFGENAVPYHAVSIALHALNGCLIWVFLQRRNPSGWNLCGPLLFTVYPVAWQAVAWISTMSDLLVAACMLASSLVFMQACQTGSLKKLTAAGVLGVCALPIKECGVAAIPLLGLLYIEQIARRDESKLKLPAAIPFFIVAGLVLILYLFFTTHHVRLAAGILPEHSYSPLSMIRSLSYYLLYLAQPFSFIPLPAEGTIQSLLHWSRGTSQGLAAAAIVASAFLLSAIWAPSRYRVYILWIILTLLPASTFTGYQASRYLYLATVPFCMLVNEGLKNAVWEKQGRLYSGIKPALGIAFAGAMVLFIRTNWSASGKYDYMHIHSETQKLINHVTRAIPGNLTDYEVWWVEEKPTPVPFIQLMMDRTNRIKQCRKIVYFTQSDYERERKVYRRISRVAVFLNGRGPFPPSYEKTDDLSSERENIPFQDVEIPAGMAIVTDDRSTTENLVGEIDRDSPGERALAIRWDFGDKNYSAYHIYVKEDRYAPEFLVSLPSRQQKYEWYPGNPGNAPLLIGGPQWEREYRFMVYGIATDRTTECLETSAPVLMRMDSR